MFLSLISIRRKLAIFFTCFIDSSNSTFELEEILFLKLFKISFLFFPFTANMKGKPNFLYIEFSFLNSSNSSSVHWSNPATTCSFVDSGVNEPIFVFSHILVPHPPYLFGPEGEPVSSVRPQGLESWQDKEGYINNVKFANKKITQVIDELLTDPENPPVIIIQADHGYGFDIDVSELSKENLEQKMSIFSAYYLPDTEENLSDDVITPVNTFRIIFNSYFNADYDLLENKMYLINDYGEDFIDVTNILTSP